MSWNPREADGGSRMDRINLWIFFALGEDVGRLSVVRGGFPLFTLVRPLERTYTALDLLVNPPSPPLFSPPVVQSRQPATELLEFVRSLLWMAQENRATVVSQD